MYSALDGCFLLSVVRVVEKGEGDQQSDMVKVEDGSETGLFEVWSAE